MNSEEVLEALEPLANVKVRPVEHQSKTRVIVTPEIVTIRPGSGGKLIPLSDNGVKGLMNFTGVPATLPKKLSTDTLGRMLTELLAQKGQYNLLMENDEVMDFSKGSGVRTIHPEKVITTIEKAVQHAEFHRVLLYGNYSATIDIVAQEQKAVARGDIVRAGATITFSPINTVLPAVQASVLRLICTNGATNETVLREFHGGGGNGDGNIWDWFRNSVRDAVGSLEHIVERYRAMKEERIPPDQRASMLEALLRGAGIKDREAEAVRAQAIAGPPRNTYELMNLITYASSHVIQEPNGIRRAQLVAAKFCSEQEHAKICPVCHSRG